MQDHTLREKPRFLDFARPPKVDPPPAENNREGDSGIAPTGEMRSIMFEYNANPLFVFKNYFIVLYLMIQRF